ncbi:LCP family protein [Nesterenkonia sp. F]|uniref:LCP family protein n=1 Tax=Nesterenkonia sp. F TaxID=795955 RepID=UPI000255C9E6|nr:LCP family protein [Nesterenkonia sp. F]
MADREHDGAPRRHRPRRVRVVSPTAPTPSARGERPRRGRRVLGWSLVAVATLVVVAVAVVGVYLQDLRSSFDENRNVLEMNLDDDTAARTDDDVVNLLLLGSDTRGEGQDLAEIKGEDGQRSDTMMFVHIPADRSTVYVMSIVRDLWVDIPGVGTNRINTAINSGGYPLVVDTVEELLDTHIDHAAIIDFEGFKDLTEALDGVYVDNPQAFSSGQHNPDFYPEGTIRLEGANALRYVRERKTFSDGDFTRVENQRRVVQAIIDRFLSAETLTNPARVSDIVESMVPYLWLDEGLDADTVAGYAVQLRNLRSDDIEMFTIPAGEPMTTSGGAQVITRDEAAMDVLRRSLDEESMDDFVDDLAESEANPFDTAETDSETDPETGTETESGSGTETGDEAGEVFP